MEFLDEVIKEAGLAREEVIRAGVEHFGVSEEAVENTPTVKDYQKIIRLSHELKALLEKYDYEV